MTTWDTRCVQNRNYTLTYPRSLEPYPWYRTHVMRPPTAFSVSSARRTCAVSKCLEIYCLRAMIEIQDSVRRYTEPLALHAPQLSVTRGYSSEALPPPPSGLRGALTIGWTKFGPAFSWRQARGILGAGKGYNSTCFNPGVGIASTLGFSTLWVYVIQKFSNIEDKCRPITPFYDRYDDTQCSSCSR